MTRPKQPNGSVIYLMLWLAVGLIGPLAFAKSPATTKISSASSAPSTRGSARQLTAAILDFDANVPGSPDLGRQLGDALSVMLSGNASFDLVDRTDLARSLREQELSLTGLISNDQAVKVGKLVGARIIVTGKAFTLGDQFFITAKLIGTETSLVDGVLVKGKVGDDAGALAIQLAERLAVRIREVGPKLTADDQVAKDPLPALKERLAKLPLPVIAVVITEHLIAHPETRADPAAETEIKSLLTQAGFTVKDVSANKLTDWLRDIDKTKGAQWPQELSTVDMVVTGEGLSETAARIGGLISSTGRVEINVIQRKDGRIVLADKETTRGVDLSETMAAKKALEKAGHLLGLKVLEYFAASPAPETKH